MSTNEVKLSSDDLKIIREKKFVLLRLKEEWELARHNLVNRKSLMLGHIAAASLTVLIGICLLIILEYNATNKVLKIATSGVTAAGGILALIKSIMDKASANKDNITKILQVMKSDGKEGSHELITIEDKELIDLKTERHENYIKFLTRINYLIKLERRIGVWFVILMSLLVIVLAIITIFVSVSPLDIPFPNLSIYLAIGIIVSGAVWLINITLSHLIEFFEIASNIHWSSADDTDHDAPIALFYLLMKRTYIVGKDVYEMYFDEFRTGNDDVTFFGTEIDARPILQLVMVLDKKVCELSGHEICHEHVEILVNTPSNDPKTDKEIFNELIKILVRKPGGGGNSNTNEINDLIAIHAKLNGSNGNGNLTSEKEPKGNDENNSAHEISEQTENNNARKSFITKLEEMLKWNDHTHSDNIKLAVIIARKISFGETDDQNKKIIEDFLKKHETKSDETVEHTNQHNTVVILAERFKDIIIDKIISKFKSINHDTIKEFILSIDKDILIEIFKSEIKKNKKLFPCHKHTNLKPKIIKDGVGSNNADGSVNKNVNDNSNNKESNNSNESKLIDLAITVAKEITLNQYIKNKSNLAKSQEKTVFDEYKKHKPSNLDEALKLKEPKFIKLCREYTKIYDENMAIKDIRLTQRHNHEIRRLLCGLEHDLIEIITEHDHTEHDHTKHIYIENTIKNNFEEFVIM
ncbi:3799_t:CDS:2 [Cetraspora pellucida]|uniref:3799_t:CDS:1 n=1 Tax=Cetraspora pellucida TaxID=1433469 RepID=A0A9N9CAQ0_9GLOM|nr:3799_t:CDS:2 [Cetraspora pellucida]